MTGHDGTLTSLKQLYRQAGVLAAGAPLPTELARTLDEAEEITGCNLWGDRVGMDSECPAPSPEALARLVVAINENSFVWRAPEFLS